MLDAREGPDWSSCIFDFVGSDIDFQAPKPPQNQSPKSLGATSRTRFDEFAANNDVMRFNLGSWA